MLSKNQIAARIEEISGVKPNLVKSVLDALSEVAEEEIAAGQDFTVPGVVRLAYGYRAPQKKGARYKKGATFIGFGGVEQTAEEDSKPITEQVKLRAYPTGGVARLKPGSKAEAQKEFLKSKAGRAVRSRKAK